MLDTIHGHVAPPENAFQAASRDEARAMPAIRIAVEAIMGYPVSLVTDRTLQMEHGDLCWKNSDGAIRYTDVKCDTTRYPNLFMEEWSNLNTGRQGWLRTLRSRVVTYAAISPAGNMLCFVDIMEMRKLIDTAPAHLTHATEGRWRLRCQGVYQQHNDTWGRGMPVRDLLAHNAAYRTLCAAYDYSTPSAPIKLDLGEYCTRMRHRDATP